MQNKVECCMMDKLQDVLAAVTRIDEEIKYMIRFLGNIEFVYDIEKDSGRGDLIRLFNRWLKGLDVDTEKITNGLDEFLTKQV